MRGVYVKDCDCTDAKVFKTDRDAELAVLGHWEQRFSDENHRYWKIHGPSGHCIALNDTVYGPLPPHG